MGLVIEDNSSNKEESKEQTSKIPKKKTVRKDNNKQKTKTKPDQETLLTNTIIKASDSLLPSKAINDREDNYIRKDIFNEIKERVKYAIIAGGYNINPDIHNTIFNLTSNISDIIILDMLYPKTYSKYLYDLFFKLDKYIYHYNLYKNKYSNLKHMINIFKPLTTAIDSQYKHNVNNINEEINEIHSTTKEVLLSRVMDYTTKIINNLDQNQTD